MNGNFYAVALTVSITETGMLMLVKKIITFCSEK